MTIPDPPSPAPVPPASPSDPQVPTTLPPAVLAYRVYCLLMAALYLALIPIGGFFVVAEPGMLSDLDMDRIEALITGWLLIVVSIPLAVAFAAGPFLPRKKWAWVVGLVLLMIGMSSACCAIVCLPILLLWIKDDVKAWYGA